jgi:hypothetical protein
MSACIVVVGLPVQVQSANELVLAPDAYGTATVNGCSIRSLSHLPGGIAVIEYADGLVLIPWPLLNALLQQAASQLCAEQGVT